MSAVSLITPTYWRDLERCELLCESVDRFVASFTRHYLIVADEDLPLFAKFKRGRRDVLPVSEFLPPWLKPLPRIIQRRQRRYWWSFRARPVNGWHVQQFAKIEAARTVPEDVVCMLDSDVLFFRSFDLANFARADRTPLYIRPRDVAASAPLHAAWVRSSHRLLGLDAPSFPADDFIGHVIFWNKRSVRGMTDRIEAVTGLDWIEALCRARAISEYMLYGYFVRSDPALLRNHVCAGETPCLSYWEAEPLGEASLENMLGSAADKYAAFSAQSLSDTPTPRIRAVLDRLQSERSWSGAGPAPLAPQATPEDTRGAKTSTFTLLSPS
jgi:hypothetical protein